MISVVKRDGQEVAFDPSKIYNAVEAANKDVPISKRIRKSKIDVVVDVVTEQIEDLGRPAHVEEIQDMVIRAIQGEMAFDVATAYAVYRYKQQLRRQINSTDASILTILNNTNQEVNVENSNKDPMIVSVQRDYIAGETSKDISNRLLLPEDVVEADKLGIIHFHDKDYFAQRMHNCCLINMKDILDNNTVISKTLIETPKSLRTAANLVTQVVAQVASMQYGGQTFTLSHLAPYVDISRRKIRKSVQEHLTKYKVSATDEQINDIAEELLRDEVKSAIQTIQYQLITLQTTNGQAPFVSVFMYLDEVEEGQLRDDLALLCEEMLNQRILGVKNIRGQYVPPAFPKILYVLDEDNLKPNSKYYYLTRLAAICTIHRMVPDYISAKVMKEQKGDVYPCMGCRSFLTPDRFTDKGLGNFMKAKDYVEGQHRYYGRFNQGVVTVNLVDIACSSEKDMDLFWKVFDERMQLCHKALRIRHDRLKGTKADAAPLQWMYGSLARLEHNEVIDPLLYNGYSTLSLGYAGLYEMTKYMTGHSHTEPEGYNFAMSVMQKLNEYTNKWKEEENIDYSLYGTPLESTTYKFAKCLQKRWGIIKDVTDHDYITNSYHICVREEIDAFKKLELEAEFQKLSPGGAVSYVEVPNMSDNLDAVITILEWMYDHIMYAEINGKFDHCLACGFEGEVKLVTENNKHIWECPVCHNRDTRLLHVTRRTCGYIGTEFWNQGRTDEIGDRVLHL